MTVKPKGKGSKVDRERGGWMCGQGAVNWKTKAQERDDWRTLLETPRHTNGCRPIW
jgi:hypothetical protein